MVVLGVFLASPIPHLRLWPVHTGCVFPLPPRLITCVVVLGRDVYACVITRRGVHAMELPRIGVVTLPRPCPFPVCVSSLRVPPVRPLSLSCPVPVTPF